MKPMPCSLESEAAILGALLLEPAVYPLVTQWLTVGDFYLRTHADIFEAINGLAQDGKPTTPFAVADVLTTAGNQTYGGVAYLTKLTEECITTSEASVEEACKAVRGKWLLRRAITCGMTWAEKIPTDEREAEAVVADFEAQVFALSDRRITAGLRQAGPELKGLVQRMEKLSTSGAPVLSGVATGFRLLDEYTGGFQPGDLVLIAGRPGSGKTSLALNIATRCQAAKPVVTAFFSLEMTAESLLTRMLVQEARLDYKAMRAARIGQDGWATVARVLPGLSMAPLWIDDTARQTVNEMRAKCRRLAAQQPLGMVVIDHIGKVSPSRWFKSLNESLTEISQDCKTMAKELNVPVVVLSQLSRECERRSPKHPRPMLSDLRDSGSLEQDADLVLMLYRDSVYNPKDEDAQGKAELIIAKQRNGPCVDVMLTFQNAFMRFESYTPAPDVP